MEHIPRYLLFVRGIHQSPVNSLNKGEWRGALMFSLICTCTNGCVNNRDAGDLICNRVHDDVIVMDTSMDCFGVDQRHWRGSQNIANQKKKNRRWQCVLRSIQCGTLITRSNFSKFSQLTSHSSPVKARYAASVVSNLQTASYVPP